MKKRRKRRKQKKKRKRRQIVKRKKQQQRRKRSELALFLCSDVCIIELCSSRHRSENGKLNSVRGIQYAT